VVVKSSGFWGVTPRTAVKVKQAYVGLLFDLVFHPEDGSYMFLRNASFQQSIRVYITENRKLYKSYNSFGYKHIGIYIRIYAYMLPVMR
jgi:hypothetical protein